MTSNLAYGCLALVGLALMPQAVHAQPYTTRPTVVVDMGALDPYGYPPKSDYTQGIESVPVAPIGAPESLSPTGMNAPVQELPAQDMPAQNGEKLVLPQFAHKKTDMPFEKSNRQLTKPVLEDILESASDYGADTHVAAPQNNPEMQAKPSHDEIFQAAVANAMKPPPAPASKPSDIAWQKSAFDDIIKPSAPAHKPTMDEVASAAIAAPAQSKSISPFNQQPAMGNSGMDRVSVDFERNSVVLSPEDKLSLDRLVSRIGNAMDTRLQLRAYASENPDDSVSGARRLSLSRALTVRAYLMQQNVSPTRIDVRALGSDAPDGPADRVDLVVIQ